MPSITSIGSLGDTEVEFGSGKERRCRRSWLVKTDARFFSELALLSLAMTTGASGYTLPIPFISTHPDDITFLCKRLRARRSRNSPLHWTAEAEYDTAPIGDQEEEDQSPTDRAAKFSWGTIKYQKAVEKSRNGNAILNSAGDYFDPPPLKDVSRITVTGTKNMTQVPPGILSWADKLNSDTFEIDGVTVGVNVAKITAVGIGERQKEGDEWFRAVSYTLEFDEENEWEGVYLNQGFYGLVGGVMQRIQVDNKNAVTPKLLTDAGVYIVDPVPSDATYETYDIYQEMAFNGNLPLT